MIAGQHLTYQEYLVRLRRVPVAEVLGRVPGGDYPLAAAAALLLNASAAEAGDPSGLTGRLLRVVAVLSAEGCAGTCWTAWPTVTRRPWRQRRSGARSGRYWIGQ